MKYGIRYPDYELPVDIGAVRAFAQAVEDMGYDHITHFDHIAGMSERTRPNWRAPYTYKDEFGEAFIMLATMAACTTRIHLMTAILVLPLRPTALVAKQAATIDLLSGGRLRLGVAAGWNDVEFELLGVSFDDRYARMGEQIDVLRRFWTKDVVSFRGTWHRVRAVGINPLPVQRPIPIWMGSGIRPTRKALARIARIADGIIPLWSATEDRTKPVIEMLHDELRAAGRDPEKFDIEGHIDLGRSNTVAGMNHGAEILVVKTDQVLADELLAWSALGATDVEFKARECGLASLDEHLRAAERFLEIARSTISS